MLLPVRNYVPASGFERLNEGGAMRALLRSALFVALGAAVGCSHSSSQTDGGNPDGGGDAGSGGLVRIQHIVIIMQENRSFDHYFGTYPGADGIPMDDAGVPCLWPASPSATGDLASDRSTTPTT
jgi:phospholipase C